MPSIGVDAIVAATAGPLLNDDDDLAKGPASFYVVSVWVPPLFKRPKEEVEKTNLCTVCVYFNKTHRVVTLTTQETACILLYPNFLSKKKKNFLFFQTTFGQDF